MESGMLKAFDDREYSANVPSEAYSSEGSAYLQTSPEYDSKCSSIGNEDDCRWTDGKNVQIIETHMKEELTEVSDNEAERSSCEEDEGVDNEYEESPEDELAEEQVDIDSDDYDIEFEYPGETINENGDIIHVFTVDPDKVLEYSSDEESCDVQDWHVNESEHITEEIILENEETEEESEYIDDSNVECIESTQTDDKVDIPEQVANTIEETFDDGEYLSENNDKEKTVEENKEFNIDKSFEEEVNVDDFFVKAESKLPKKDSESTLETGIVDEIPLFSPNIEELKKFFLTPTKSGRSLQKSLSLPHSPSHLSQEDEGRTSFSFEDLNLSALNDFSLDADKSAKMFDILQFNDYDEEIRTLNDDDINSFLITEPKNKTLQSVSKVDVIKKEFSTPDVSSSEISKTEFSGIDIKTKVHGGEIAQSIKKSINEVSNSELKKMNLEDDLSQQDMEIECPLVGCSIIPTVNSISAVAPPLFSTPLKKQQQSHVQKENHKVIISETPKCSPIKIEAISAEETPNNVLSFCIEKNKVNSEIVKIQKDIKFEQDDYVDVESLTDTVEMPVLEANNVKSLLEQFEANEKFSNPNKREHINELIVNKDSPAKSLANGLRLQEAALQLNKNKMRQIMMPTSSPNCAAAQKPMQDHDYCSPNKRTVLSHSLQYPPKRRQSLLKPEVVTSNHIIKSTRHRTCKSKKVVYAVSSDDEDSVAKQIDKKDIKNSLISNHRKKLSPQNEDDTHSVKPKRSLIEADSVISSASDFKLSQSSQCSGGSIKLTIKNKTQVILKLDEDENIKQQNQSSPNNVTKVSVKSETDTQREKKQATEITLLKSYNKIETSNVCNEIKPQLKPNVNKQISTSENFRAKPHIIVKKELQKIENVRPKIEEYEVNTVENFIPQPYYRNKDPLGLMAAIEKEKNESIEQHKPEISDTVTLEPKQPAKKKLNLQEYKLRKEANSNNSSTPVSPELASIANQDIFNIQPAVSKDKLTPTQISPSKAHSTSSSASTSNRSSPKDELDESKKLFDPIREASRKILMQNKRQKVEAIRKRDEEIVMRKIPKIENLELKPLISDVEIMNMVTLAKAELQKQLNTPEPPKQSEYEEIIMVSIGTNTENIIKDLPESNNTAKDSSSNKSSIYFTIKKLDQNVVLKHNVFDTKKNCVNEKSKQKRKSEESESRPQADKVASSKDTKIDKERYKDITATLKSVKKNSDVKISSNSLFASIQDTVMKKAPESEKPEKKIEERKRQRSEERQEQIHKKIKTIIVNQTPKEEHGEDKVILHLPRERVKPQSVAVKIQTEPDSMFVQVEEKQIKSSKSIPERSEQVEANVQTKNKTDTKASESRTQRSTSKSNSKRSVSRERETRKSRERKVRTYSRGMSSTRNRSRSSDRRYRRRCSPYRRRSKSPYRRRSRSPYKQRSERNSSYRKSEQKSQSRQRSPTKVIRKQSKSPIKIVKSPQKVSALEEKCSKSPEALKEKGPVSPMCPAKTSPTRKPTVSESSDSSSSYSSSSSGSSSYSRSPCRSYYTPSPPRFADGCEDRKCMPPVEERRIVYVGKLETDITKAALRSTFSKFGPITEVTLHTKDNGSRYGFVTFRRGRDAWTAVESARSRLPHYDVGFGGRRAFCRQRYADLDGLEAEYRENDYLPMPVSLHKTEDVSFEVLLQETKKKLSKMKTKKQEPTE